MGKSAFDCFCWIFIGIDGDACLTALLHGYLTCRGRLMQIGILHGARDE